MEEGLRGGVGSVFRMGLRVKLVVCQSQWNHSPIAVVRKQCAGWFGPRRAVRLSVCARRCGGVVGGGVGVLVEDRPACRRVGGENRVCVGEVGVSILSVKGEMFAAGSRGEHRPMSGGCGHGACRAGRKRRGRRRSRVNGNM